MNKISRKAAAAFVEGKSFDNNYSGNTQVYVENDGWVRMYLFDNEIARRKDDKTWISTAGYPTRTTKMRLNELPGVHIHHHKYELYLNNQLWEDSHLWTEVTYESD
jgi:hypothetical protein